MTEAERERITELRYNGYGYKKISSLTGLPQNTVKSFCRRHPIVNEGLTDHLNQCMNCGKPLAQTPHKRKKKFCSDRCRMAWWNAHPEKVNRKAYYTVVCRQCGKRFESYGNANRRFCSLLCYAEYRRKENANV